MYYMKGLTTIYWGQGKGKTTAAIGAALRALGQGQRVLFMQFIKGEDWKTGEANMFEKMENVELCIVGKGWVRIMGDQKPIEEHEEAAQAGFEYALQQMTKGNWDVVVLDEILSAVDSGLLTMDQIKELIRAKPENVHFLMTGHKAYTELIELADVVTNMEKVKHAYDKGVQAQKGVDF